MMGVAERVLAVVEGEVRFPVVMYCLAFKLWQDTNRFHPYLSAFGVDTVVGEAVGAGNMQPV